MQKRNIMNVFVLPVPRPLRRHHQLPHRSFSFSSFSSVFHPFKEQGWDIWS